MESQLKLVIANVLNVDPALIDENSSSKTLEKWDSLYHMNLIIAVEEQFGVTFGDDEIASLTSYKALLNSINKHRSN